MNAIPASTLTLDPDLRFAPERAEDARAVEALIDHAFGPGRFTKTAERLREGNHPRLDLSFCAWSGARMAGAVRQWPILIGDQRAIFLGPFAIDPAWRRQGLGRRLIQEAGEAAQAASEQVVLLVGDLSYFGPLGFERVPAGRLEMPGPVDARRVLWRAFAPGAAETLSGEVKIPRD
ncbi:MAG: N-acetyltransferase [Caulobacteraceae bacterium]